MAKYDYTGVYNTAVRLINRFGAEFTITKIDTSYTKIYNPDTGSYIYQNGSGDVSNTPPTTSVTADGVISGFEDKDRYDTSIKKGDKLLLAVKMDAPKPQDVYTIGGTDYSYVDHETIQPASTFQPLLYKIQVRV